MSTSFISERKTVKINPVWADRIKKAKQDINSGNVTEIKSGDVWRIVRKISES